MYVSALQASIYRNGNNQHKAQHNKKNKAHTDLNLRVKHELCATRQLRHDAMLHHELEDLHHAAGEHLSLGAATRKKNAR